MDTRLFHRQFRKDLTDQSKNTVAGLFWLLLEPVLLLLVYSFVFGVVFTARLPPDSGYPFVVYLAVALWPWLAFSQSIMRSLSVIGENLGLIRKMPMDTHALVLARVSAVFAIQMIAWLLVLIILSVLAGGITFMHLWLALLTVLQLYCAALGIALLLAGMALFIRDIRLAMPMLLMLVFFSTPIIWTMHMMPAAYRHYFYLNPLTHVVETIRGALLHGDIAVTTGWWLNWPLAALLLALGWWVFGRLAPWFEEFA